MLEDNPRPLQSSHDKHVLDSSRDAIRRSRELLLRTRLPTKRATGIRARIEELKKMPGAREEVSLRVPD